jgi:hypothetical protein
MEMDYASIQPALTTLLRNRPLGTTADINKQTVAYWDGHEVRGIHLRHDESDKSDRLDGDFDLDERTLNQLYADLIAWMAAPRYTVRAELVDWLKDAPPSNAGAWQQRTLARAVRAHVLLGSLARLVLWVEFIALRESRLVGRKWNSR